MSKKQDAAVQALDSMLNNFKKPKPIEYKDIILFYNALQEIYDNELELIEEALFEEIDDEAKFKELKKLSDLMEVNIF